VVDLNFADDSKAFDLTAEMFLDGKSTIVPAFAVDRRPVTGRPWQT
jgi:hypothetical protein